MTTDRAQSVLDRLLKQARQAGRNYHLTLQLFFQEEFLRRLQHSRYSHKLILKGGLLLYALSHYEGRPTRDIDFLMKGIMNEPDHVRKVMEEIVTSDSDNDFVEFAVGNVKPSIEQREYHGVRVNLIGKIKKVKIPFHIDLGVGDVIVPEKPQEISLPTQLPHFEAPVVLAYPLTSVIAEKLETIFSKLEQNSRMKDFFDIYTIACRYQMDGRSLQEAIDQTFQKRGASLDINSPTRLSALKHNPGLVGYWDRFARDVLYMNNFDFGEIIDGIHKFVEPALNAVIYEDEFFKHWDPINMNWFSNDPTV